MANKTIKTEKTEIREHLSVILKNLKPLHDTEYKAIFTLPENSFFQKLVCKEVLEKIRVRPADYFRALMFLNYFTNIIQDRDYSVCDNLENLSKTLREIERKTATDSGENGKSYLSLETVVFETGAWMKEKMNNSEKINLTPKYINEIKKRYGSEKPVELKNAKKADAFYEGIGEMTLSQVSEESQPFLKGAYSRQDIEAIVFSDSVSQFLNNKKSKEIVLNLSKGGYLTASLIALNYLTEESSIEKIKQSLEKND